MRQTQENRGTKASAKVEVSERLAKGRRALQGNVVEKLEEKIERLEGENEELRIDLLTTENALKRLQLGVKHTMLLRAKEKWDADDERRPGYLGMKRREAQQF